VGMGWFLEKSQGLVGWVGAVKPFWSGAPAALSAVKRGIERWTERATPQDRGASTRIQAAMSRRRCMVRGGGGYRAVARWCRGCTGRTSRLAISPTSSRPHIRYRVLL